MGNLDFAFYLSLFRRRLPFFLGIAVVVSMAGVLVIYALPSVYQATAKILVESPQIPTDLARSTVPTGAIEQFQIIQEDILSRENLLAIADHFSIYADRQDLTQTDMVDDMTARINISPVRLDAAGGGGSATVFDISFLAGEPGLAADVANDLVSMILRKDVELRTARATDTVRFFSQEVTRLDGELKALDGQILEFKNAHINALPDSLDFRRDQQSSAEQRLLLLAQEATSLRRRQADLQSHRFVPGAAPTTPEEKSLGELREKLVEQQAMFSEDSPTIKALRSRIDGLTAQIRGETKPGGDAPAPAALSDNDFELGTVNDRLAAIAQEEGAIAKSNEELNASIQATPGNETVLNSLQRNHENLQAQYNASVARLADASTGQQIELRLKGERLSLIESAVPPQAPISPKRKMLLIATAVVSLLLGLAAVVLPELLNKRIRRPVELVDKLDIRPMITVPYIATGGEKGRKMLTSAAALMIFVGAIPLLLFALHSFVAPVDAMMNRTLASLGLSDQSRNG